MPAYIQFDEFLSLFIATILAVIIIVVLAKQLRQNDDGKNKP